MLPHLNTRDFSRESCNPRIVITPWDCLFIYYSILFQFTNIEIVASGNAAFITWTHLGMFDDNDQRWRGGEWVLTKRRLYEARMWRERKGRETKRGKKREGTKAVIRGPEVSEQGMLVLNEIGSFWPCRTTFGSYSTRLSPFLIHSTVSPYHRNRSRRCRSSITGDARSGLPAILEIWRFTFISPGRRFLYSLRRIVNVTRGDRKDSSMIRVLLGECNVWRDNRLKIAEDNSSIWLLSRVQLKSNKTWMDHSSDSFENSFLFWA